ncbi:hypothetical protein Agub_g14686 [Astrephomene gubernaculifera]|uniref:Glycosyl transferase CAP10 domain-containing protein n=1 Tax=Astrephomene gubernaculifera TaxID=47775 RepID=A0AAD3E1T6_9CHLO|nr:hypothetical protein Agub_g14686 [Astrephomene gubernaculifera]
MQYGLLVSLLAMMLATVQAEDALYAGLPFLDKPTTVKDVLILREPPPGYEPATTEEEWDSIFRDNLFPDLQPYTSWVVKKGRPMGLSRLATQILALQSSTAANRLAVVVLRGGRCYRALPTGIEHVLKLRVDSCLEELCSGAARLGLRLPDTVFVFNPYDTPVCRLVGGCWVPVFSMHKRYDWALKRSLDSDVLFPHMGHRFDRLVFFPWTAKDKRGLLRASMQARMSPSCTRVALANLSASPRGAPYLDCGFVRNYREDFHMPQTFMRPYVGLSKHARYRFLLNADGHVSSSRLGYIMQINSVVLKERSPWLEYYYRSLQPGGHVIEYSADTILDLMKQYDDPARDAELRALANASQHFAAKYLTPEGKVRYAVRALQEYSRLFTGMGDFVRGIKGLLEAPAAADEEVEEENGGREGAKGRGKGKRSDDEDEDGVEGGGGEGQDGNGGGDGGAGEKGRSFLLGRGRAARDGGEATGHWTPGRVRRAELLEAIRSQVTVRRRRRQGGKSNE